MSVTLPTERTPCVCCGGDGGGVPEAVATDYEYGTTSQPFTFVRCGACGHLFLNPRPTSEAAAVIYGAGYYTQAGDHDSGLLARIKDAVVRRRFGRLLQQLPSPVAILDVGCGDGALLLSLRQAFPDSRLAGVDASISAPHRDRLERAGVEVVEGLVEDADLGAARFDLVIMNQVIEHLWNVRGVMQALRRALKPGGLVTISTPDADGYDRRWFRRSTWGGYYVPRHLNLFTAAGLARVLRSAGYDIVEQRPLVAPLIWVRNIQYALHVHGYRIARWFTDRNLPALALFTLADLGAIALGLRTSNQQCIARRPLASES